VWKFLKIGGLVVVGIILVIGLYLAILFYPGVLFSNHLNHGNFTVHSQQELDDDIVNILDRVDAALSTSVIYDSSIEHDIFFGADNVAFGFVQKVRWKIISATLKIPSVLTYNVSWPPNFSHIITFRIPDVAGNALVSPGGSRSINLTQTLSHEVVHTFLLAELGLPALAKTPMWKQEGYGDYIAASNTTFADPSYSIRNSVERILAQDLSWMQNAAGAYKRMQLGCVKTQSIQNEEGRYWPTCYYIARVLLEYLFNVKGLTFDAVMSPGITDVATFKELILAYESGSLSGHVENDE